MLRALREGAGMSLRALADSLGDTTHGHIGRIETGERTPTPELTNRIVQAIASHLARRPEPEIPWVPPGVGKPVGTIRVRVPADVTQRQAMEMARQTRAKRSG